MGTASLGPWALEASVPTALCLVAGLPHAWNSSTGDCDSLCGHLLGYTKREARPPARAATLSEGHRCTKPGPLRPSRRADELLCSYHENSKVRETSRAFQITHIDQEFGLGLGLGLASLPVQFPRQGHLSCLRWPWSPPGSPRVTAPRCVSLRKAPLPGTFPESSFAFCFLFLPRQQFCHASSWSPRPRPRGLSTQPSTCQSLSPRSPAESALQPDTSPHLPATKHLNRLLSGLMCWSSEMLSRVTCERR